MSDNISGTIFREGTTVQKDESGAIQAVYCRTEVIAQLFGVSVRRIQQLTQDGILSTTELLNDGRRQRRYELVSTVQRYIQNLSDKAYGRQGKSEKEMELREQKMLADIALKESQGELHRLKTSIASGEYISIEEVRLDYAKFFVVFKKFAMSIPARVCGLFSGHLDPIEARRIEKELSQEVSALLASFVVAGVVEPREVKGILKDEESKTAVEEEVQSS